MTTIGSSEPAPQSQFDLGHSNSEGRLPSCLSVSRLLQRSFLGLQLFAAKLTAAGRSARARTLSSSIPRFRLSSRLPLPHRHRSPRYSQKTSRTRRQRPRRTLARYGPHVPPGCGRGRFQAVRVARPVPADRGLKTQPFTTVSLFGKRTGPVT